MGVGNAVEARLKTSTGSRLAELRVVSSTSWGTPFRGPKKLTELQIYIIDLIGNDFSIIFFWILNPHDWLGQSNLFQCEESKIEPKHTQPIVSNRTK